MQLTNCFTQNTLQRIKPKILYSIYLIIIILILVKESAK